MGLGFCLSVGSCAGLSVVPSVGLLSDGLCVGLLSVGLCVDPLCGGLVAVELVYFCLIVFWRGLGLLRLGIGLRRAAAILPPGQRWPPSGEEASPRCHRFFHRSSPWSERASVHAKGLNFLGKAYLSLLLSVCLALSYPYSILILSFPVCYPLRLSLFYPYWNVIPYACPYPHR